MSNNNKPKSQDAEGVGFSELLDLRDEFAIRILTGLMRRYGEPGYSDKAAIAESYELAEKMIDHKKRRDNEKRI